MINTDGCICLTEKNYFYLKNKVVLTELSVVIVNYNVSYFLEACLNSVLDACRDISAEIIVVDNNSSDDSCKMLGEKFSEVRLLSNKENTGFSKANNQGVAIAQGTYVLILNPDTFLPEDSINQVIDFIKKQKDPGAVGIQFMDGTGNFLPECKRNIPTLKIAGQKLRGNSKRYYAGHINQDEVAKVDVLTGAFMLIKRETYLKVGGFDEDYFMFGEDIDLSYKLLNQGYQNYYYGKARMIHYKGESTKKDVVYLRNFYGAMQIFYKKHFKTGVLQDLVSKMAVKTMILSDSFKKAEKEKKNNKKKLFLYLGEDQDILNKLKDLPEIEEVEMSRILPSDVSRFDCIIFDNSFLSSKEIITCFYKLRTSDIAKRIIPKNTRFYLGSDSSDSRGEVVEF